MGLLNSSLYRLWFSHKGKRKGNLLELYYTPLTQVPIKKVSGVQQKQVIDIVDEILEIKKSNDYSRSSEQHKIASECEAHLDDIVARLYGLTDAERAIIEGRDR
jgi:adenine-specific DNA-methyltransferase